MRLSPGGRGKGAAGIAPVVPDTTGVILRNIYRILFSLLPSGGLLCIISFAPAGVMELVDVADSKSAAGDSVGVRVPPPAPRRRSKLHIACSDFFQKSERAHFAAPPLQPRPAALGSRLVFLILKVTASKVFGMAKKKTRPLSCLLFWVILVLFRYGGKP